MSRRCTGGSRRGARRTRIRPRAASPRSAARGRRPGRSGPANFPRTRAARASARSGSISTATTRRALSARNRVSAPSPGPTSRTQSSFADAGGLDDALAVSGLARKCWPQRLRAGRRGRAGRARRSCCDGIVPRGPHGARGYQMVEFLGSGWLLLQVFTLENRRLENFLERHKAYYAYTGEIEIDRFLREILQKANEFVPSEAGSILLDDPMTKNSDDRLENELVFIATYGAHGEARLGQADERPGRHRRPRLRDGRRVHDRRRRRRSLLLPDARPDRRLPDEVGALRADPDRVVGLRRARARQPDRPRRVPREGPAAARDLRRLRLDLDPEPARRAARLRGRQARRPDRPLQRALPPPAADAGALAHLARRRRPLA